MPTSKHSTSADTSTAVEKLIASLTQPKKAEVELLRQAILAADSSISEGVKWNAPSFKTGEYFATTNLRTKSGVGLVLHFGAKARTVQANSDTIADPQGLLKWVATDRATMEFKNTLDIEDKRSALQSLLRQWIVHV